MDYQISYSERPLTTKTLNRIIFQEIIENNKFRCPCKKFETSFACFTARDWINIAFELNFRPYSTTRVCRKYEYQEKRELYESLMKSEKVESLFETNSSNKALTEKLAKCKTQILNDIPRTFSNIDIFNYASVLQQLYRILYSYFIYDPQLGYTQGMNLLVGALLMHSEENVAFWLFVTLIEDYEMREVFSDTLGGVNQHCRVISILIEKYLPKLAKHFDILGVEI